MPRKFTSEQINNIATILGLSKAEKAVFSETLGIAKSLSVIARHSGIPRGSISSIVKKLEKRGLLIQSKGLTSEKSRIWRSNVKELARKLNAIIQSNI